MKKIMFNDSYGLTKAVLEGRKTMTRRIAEKVLVEDIDQRLVWTGEFKKPKYKVGEVVAVAQNYEDAGIDAATLLSVNRKWVTACGTPGWRNKMFVSADYMNNFIRITNVRVERLQDISDEDVYKEGFINEAVNNGWGNYAYHHEAMLVYYDRLGRSKEIRSREPREAFAALIDKVSGKGVWDSNPWVFVYEFELMK